jgi:Rad3-related DNA helicase
VIIHPSSYGIPHDKWRKGQQEAVEWIRNAKEQFVILQAPVGSGKSAIGSGLGRYGNVRAITASINLQDQYRDGYNFHALYGMGNYKCDLYPMWMADNCSYPTKMSNCPAHENCDYLIQRELAKKNRRVALSYAYYLAANWTRENPSDYLYMDEAHLLLLSILRGHYSIEYTTDIIRKAKIDIWEYTEKHDLDRILAIMWIKKLVGKQEEKLAALKRRSIGPQTGKAIAYLSREIDHMHKVIGLLDAHPEDFWVKLDGDSFTVRPLTVSAFAKDFLIGADKVVFTSATIGHPKSFADELGIPMRDWTFHDMPSQWMSHEMPIYVYKNAPRLKYDMSEAAKKQWADIIAGIIEENNPDWSALIHVASGAQERDLAERLARRVDPSRIYITDGRNTGDKIEQWRERLEYIPNTVAISSSFHQGLDAGDVNINIIAKIPFITLDEYGRAFLRRNKDMYRWMAALGVMQAAGRIRRGEPEHYEVAGEPRRKIVAIVDSAYKQVQRDFSEHFINCMVEV